MRDSLSTKQTVQIIQNTTSQQGEKIILLVLTLPTNPNNVLYLLHFTGQAASSAPQVLTIGT